MSYFKICMDVIKKEGEECESNELNAFSDSQLVIAATAEMSRKLRVNRVFKDRNGWFDANVCSLHDLYSMREKALSDNDHVSVLNFTAMIAMREAS